GWPRGAGAGAATDGAAAATGDAAGFAIGGGAGAAARAAAAGAVVGAAAGALVAAALDAPPGALVELAAHAEATSAHIPTATNLPTRPVIDTNMARYSPERQRVRQIAPPPALKPP